MSLGGALLALLAWSMLMDEPVRRGRWGHLIMLMGVVGLVASMVGMVLFAVGLVWRPGRGRPRTVAV